jgi:L-lactate dehydrogenase complex protein LldF
VKINIPRHLINLRRDIVDRHLNGFFERKVYRMWARMMGSSFLYNTVGQFQKLELRRRAGADGWVTKLPKVASGWTQIRDMPAPAKKTFHQMWKKRPAKN